MKYNQKLNDMEMKVFLEAAGYFIDNETDLVEMALNEGFKWDEEEGAWVSVFEYYGESE